MRFDNPVGVNDAERWLGAFRTRLIDNINKTERELKTASNEIAEMEGSERVVFEFCAKGRLAAYKEFLRLSDSCSPEKISLIADTLSFGIEELIGEYGFEIANVMHELRRLKIADFNKNPEFYFGSGRYPNRNNDYKEGHLDDFQISRGIFSQTFRTVAAFLYEAGILENLLLSYSNLAENYCFSSNLVVSGAQHAVDEVIQYFADYPAPQTDIKSPRREANHVTTAFHADSPDPARWFRTQPLWSVDDVVTLLTKKISTALSEMPEDAFRGGYIFTLATVRKWLINTLPNLTPSELRAAFSYLLGALYLQYSEHLPVSAKLHYAMNGSYVTRNDIFHFLYFDKRLDSLERESLVDYTNADWSIFHPQFIFASAFMLAAGGIVFHSPEGVKEEEYIRDRHSGILAACDTIRKGLKLSEIISDTTDPDVHRLLYSLISTFRESTFPDEDD